jgi:hypothetical protein
MCTRGMLKMDEGGKEAESVTKSTQFVRPRLAAGDSADSAPILTILDIQC